MNCIYSHKPSPNLPKGFLRLNLAAWLTIFIMSLGGIIAVYLYHHRNPIDPTIKTAQENIKAQEKPNGQIVTYSSNIQLITAQCKALVSKENTLVIFEHGSCVRLLEPVSDHIESACSSLTILTSPDIDFTVKPLNNNNYLIVFNDYLFCWLFAKDIAKMKHEILNDTRLAPSRSDSEEIKKLPDLEQRLGKFARLLLLEDSKTKVVKKVIKAKL